MPRYHDVVLAYEGECSLCGGCCRNCNRLQKKGGKWLCRDHEGTKPSHCIMFPLGFAVELMPETCSLRPTKLVRVDEMVHTHRVNVSGRTSLVLFQATVDDEDAEKGAEQNLYELQGKLEAELEAELYEKIPAEHLGKMVALVKKLAALEEDAPDGPEAPLSWDGAKKSEKHTKALATALCLYATRRDLILGDLFSE